MSDLLSVQNPPAQPTYLREDEQARRLLAIAVARQATSFVAAATTGRVKFSPTQLKDNIKSRIVGKDGRNARTFEEKAGVDLLLNDEPDSVVISCFDPFRREVARVALESLARDGRIQPARIEEELEKARAQVDGRAREEGARAARDLGIEGRHPAVIRVLGTLQYRTSFGQNQLAHSVETGWLCGSLAAELGFDVALARRGGLLHDLGKALDPDRDGGHSKSGAEFAQKYGELPEIVHCIASHHEETPPESWLDPLVIAGDALSGARPGARNGSTQNSLDRALAMERIARETPGVTESYAVQAGRELRVFVDCDSVDDLKAREVARMIARRIAEELRFPGQIKVTVLREMRVTEVASR